MPTVPGLAGGALAPLSAASFTKGRVWNSSADLGAGSRRSRSLKGLYSSLHVSGDVIRKPGRWHLLIGELSTAPKMEEEISGEASRVFSYHGGEVDASVDFEGHGCLAMYNFDGSGRRELVKRNSKFHGVVSIPGPGLIAVQPDVDPYWGPLRPWRISLRWVQGDGFLLGPRSGHSGCRNAPLPVGGYGDVSMVRKSQGSLPARGGCVAY